MYDTFEKLKKIGMRDVEEDSEFAEAVAILSRINSKLQKTCEELVKEECADLVLLSLAANTKGLLNAIEKIDPESAAEIQEVIQEIIKGEELKW